MNDVGHHVGIRSVPKLMVRALGLVNPMMRGLAEMSYEFDEPFILDTTKFASTSGATAMPLVTAVSATGRLVPNPSGDTVTAESSEAAE